MINLKIELANIEDLEEINTLARQVHKIHVKWRPDMYKDVKNVIEREFLEKLIADKQIYVAKLDNKIIGYLIFMIKEQNNPIMKFKKYLIIDTICVDKNYRKKGIGTRILEYANNIAKKYNCTDLQLNVNPENIDAIKLYEKFGFNVKGISYSIKVK